MSADEALASMATRESATTSEAVDFLLQTLTKPMLAKKIIRLGKEATFSPKELRTARQKSGVKTKRVGGLGSEGRWAWFPPARKPPNRP